MGGHSHEIYKYDTTRRFCHVEMRAGTARCIHCDYSFMRAYICEQNSTVDVHMWWQSLITVLQPHRNSW
jgi:hypothetical protein